MTPTTMKLPAARDIGRAVAITIAAAAPVVMAAAQAVVIRDRVAIVHPLWPPWAVAAMAIGFELCILTTGLAIVVTGHKDWKLLAAEAFLIAMSVAVAVTAAFGLAPWVLSLTIALVPVQYACAFYAAHTLYVHWYGDGTPVASDNRLRRLVRARIEAWLAPVGAVTAPPPTRKPKPAPVIPAAPAGKPAPKARKAPPKDWHPKASALLSEGYKGAEVARMIGVHPSQVSRYANGASAGAGASGAAGTGVG